MFRQLKATLTDRLGGAIIHARRSAFASGIKRLVPQPLRRYAWQIATSKSTLTILGSRMHIPPDDLNPSLVSDRYEPEVSNKISEILRPGMVFCDVGANIGIFTLFAARLVGPSGRVLAFEPVPANLEVLRQNVQLNRYANITIFEQAVSDRSGTAHLYLSGFCGCHSLLPAPESASGKTLTVQTIRLDQISIPSPIDLLKIDAEGAELSVLRSLGSQRPRNVILELNTKRLAAAGTSATTFLEQIRGMGFSKIVNLERPDGSVEAVLADPDASCNLFLS